MRLLLKCGATWVDGTTAYASSFTVPPLPPRDILLPNSSRHFVTKQRNRNKRFEYIIHTPGYISSILEHQAKNQGSIEEPLKCCFESPSTLAILREICFWSSFVFLLFWRQWRLHSVGHSPADRRGKSCRGRRWRDGVRRRVGGSATRTAGKEVRPGKQQRRRQRRRRITSSRVLIGSTARVGCNVVLLSPDCTRTRVGQSWTRINSHPL